MPPRKGNSSGSINNGSIDDLFDAQDNGEDGDARWEEVPIETTRMLLAAAGILGAALTLGVTKKKDALLVVLYYNQKQNKRFFSWTGEGLAELEAFAVKLLERAR